MDEPGSRNNQRRCWTLAVLMAAACASWAQQVKEPNQELDNLTFGNPVLRVSETLADSEALSARLDNLSEMDRFRSENGTEWKFLVDERTGRVNLMSGGAIPFIPGPANELEWPPFAEAGCRSQNCIPLSKIEGVARGFLERYYGIFRISQDELVLDPVGSVPVGDSLYYLRFQWVYGGVPVEGGSITLTINNGNLIQVGMLRIGDIKLDPSPTISRETAWQILDGYVGGFRDGDRVVEAGALSILPVTPRGMDPDAFNAPFGTMADYVLAYRIAFERPGVIGTWEALINAHTGDILRFSDSNRYGHIQGGVYKTDAPQLEVLAPFPYADYASGSYADSLGNFSGNLGACTMTGRSSGSPGGVKINDGCGAISQNAIFLTGIITFGTGPGSDCATPGGGGGNTHAARTLFWSVTQAKMKAAAYLPSNSWLQGQLSINDNIRPYCNAFWSNGNENINFYRSIGTCANTGELPGTSLHEWGHGLDQNDGSGTGAAPDNLPIESRADWTAILQLHQSCVSSGWNINGGRCGGYGNACTRCTGIRDADWMNHAAGWPWTPQNMNSPLNTANCSTSCPSCYYGPCGYEDHCESGIATQALWDFVNRDLVASPTSMDIASAWQLGDRLFYGSVPQATAMYTCNRADPPSNTTSSGCGAGSLYTTYRAADDDGDGVANGTPHAAAIFAALKRHNIACGASTDTANRNETSCPALAKPALNGVIYGGQNRLTWSAVPGATRYFVFRNETSCGTGYTRVATVSSPTLTYTDTACYTGVTYYYRIQAATAKDQCASPVSDCVTLTTEPCTSPSAPAIGTVSAPGNNQLSVSWGTVPGTVSYNVYRSVGACSGGAFTLIQSGLRYSPWTDTSVSGGTTYSYRVTAADTTGACESSPSGCASNTATGSCALAPSFAGLGAVTVLPSAACTLSLSWAAAISNCSGAVTYRVYRSRTYPFTPQAANLIASGLTRLWYADSDALIGGAMYYYIVRAVEGDAGSEDTNTVARGGVPAGPWIPISWTDTFEGTHSGGGFDRDGWNNYAGWVGTSVWTWSAAQAHDGTHSWFAANPGYGHQSDMVLLSPPFSVGPSTTVSFYHTYDLEKYGTDCFDGGTLRVTTDNGATWMVVPDADFVMGGFNGNSWGSAGNPLGGGTRCWCGGTIGPMTPVTVNLGADDGLLGMTVQLMWEGGFSGQASDVGWYVDSVNVSNAETPSACASGGGPPPRVPASMTPMKMTTADHGNSGTVVFDATNCPSTNYHLLYGKGENLSAWTVDGGKCGLGTSGSYTWSAIPDPSSYASRFLWFLVAGDNGGTIEGSWGLTSSGGEEGGAGTPSFKCGCSVKNTTAFCGTP